MNKEKLIVLIGNIVALICVVVGFILVENFMKPASMIVAGIGIVAVVAANIYNFKYIK